jgi:WD40 repeat protein/tRNA A-37 threonylcarbamoyl transferase component Bud32
MLTPPDEPTDREMQLGAVIYTCLAAGKELDLQQLQARYPQFAAELADFVAGREQIEQLAAPLRQVAQAAAAEPPGALAQTAVQEFGTYELLEVIARGGMGVIYKARQKAAKRLVALKMIRASRLASVADVSRFRNEAETVAQLDHPHIVPIYEVGEQEGQLYFSMKLMEGGSLAQHLRRFTSDPRAGARLLATIARAVHYAHQRGVLHRDLKPSNILLDAAGQPHVSDFGLARRLEGAASLTDTGAILGTPGYMAPEQALGKKGTITTATDVYGLGTILYALLTGRAPFQEDTPLDTLAQVRGREPDLPRLINPSVDRDLETICLKSLAKDPAKRYQSAEELACDLDRWLAGLPIRGRRQSRWSRSWRWVRRNPSLALVTAMALALALTLIVGALVIAWRDTQAASRRAATAEEETRRLRVDRYLNDIRQAYVAWSTGAFVTLRDILAPYQDLPPAEDLRGFEWYWLMQQAQVPAAEAPRLRRSLQGHQSDVYHVTFSVDGKQLATAGADGTARVWDAESGQELACLRGHRGDVNWVSFSPDTRRLATAGDDGTVRLWDGKTARELDHLEAHKGEATGAEFTPDGKQLVSSGSDGKVWLWDLRTRERVELTRYDGPMGMPRFSRDGQWLVVAGRKWRDASLNLCSVSDKREFARFEFASQRHNSGGVAISPDGFLVATTDDHELRLHRMPSLREIMEVPMPENRCVEAPAFSPGGGMLACPGRDGQVYVFETVFCILRHQWQAHTDRAWSVAFSPDGRTLATTGNNGEVKLWNLGTLPLAERLAQAGFSPDQVQFAPDGKTLFLGGRLANQKGCGIWDLEHGQLRAVLPQHESPYDMVHSADGTTLLDVTGDGTLYAWDVERARLRSAPLGRSTADGLALSPNGEHLAVLNADHGSALNADHGSAIWRLPLDCPPRKLEPAVDYHGGCFSPDGNLLVAGDQEGTVRVWSMPRCELIRQWNAHETDVGRACFSPDGQTLATAGPSVIKLWNGVTGRCRHTLLGHRPHIHSLAFTPDGRTLISAGTDSTLRFWHVATGRELFHLSLVGAHITNLSFSPDGRTLAASVYLNSARIFVLDASGRR